jgi:two-component sensor histidine kinase
VQQAGFREQFTAIVDAWTLAQGIVDTVREPMLVLDKDLRVIAASRAFYSAFKVSPEDTKDRLLYTLGDGQWDIPKLRVLLEKIIPEKGVMEGYEVEHEFPGLGHRTMRLNARQVFYEGGADTTILLGIEDVTGQRILEREKDELLRQFEEARAFAQAIVDTVREPFLVLDKDLRVLAVSRSFYSAFKVSSEDTQGRLLYTLGDGQWDIPKLHLLLEKIVPEHGVMEGYEVEHEFPGLGHRTMLLNARQVFYERGSHTTILLGIEDVTVQRVLEREKDVLLREKDVLLRQKDTLFEELQHRVSNSLQIIASIILMKARAVQSEETRLHLHDAHKRVLSVAAVQRQLHASGTTGSIAIAPYLSNLCESLAASMIGDSRPVSLKVNSDGAQASSREAESLGLIVTELVMNALKHAYPNENSKGQITVAYDMVGTNWKLSVSDDGIGKPDGVFAQAKSGLGTGIVKALSHQLDAQVETLTGPKGTTVSITHATFPAKVAA